MNAAPSPLETERLILRKIEAEDFVDYYRFLSEPSVVKWLGREGQNMFKVTALRIGAFLECWDAYGYGPWVAIEKASGRLVGHGGLMYKEEIGEPELLYALSESVWRQGYATEIGRASLRVAFETLGLPKVVCYTLPENTASRKTMEKLGFRYVKDFTFREFECVWYELGQEERAN